MNLFATDPDPVASARALADRHVVKMTLETAQILSTVLRAQGIADPALYRPTHIHHPCTVWASSPSGLAWTLAHGLALATEYARRFGKVHGSERVIRLAAEHVPEAPPPEDFVACVPDDLCGLPVHEAYRLTLARKYTAWGPAARWTRAERPGWL